MNPILTIDEAARVKQIVIQEQLVGPDEKMPEFAAGERQVKLSAAWLMEKAGLQKGYISGNVGLSSCHVLALVNRGGGSSAEILKLVSHVKDTVRRRFGVELHPEPVFIGFETTAHAEEKEGHYNE